MPADRQRSRPVPSSTYRIQFSKDQTFDQVRELLPYLDALGAGALYASPLLESGAGSNHGYDVVDPTRISAERGGPEGLRALVAAVREHGLGFVLDIVPNHVGVAGSQENPWWWDVLRHGKESAYATYFDIDWDAGPILLPVLDADEEKALVRAHPLRRRDRAALLRARRARSRRAPRAAAAQEVHERQRYRFGSWKRGAAELTYRRFFDVSTLAAVRVEDPEVFAATHAEILRWVDEGDGGRAARGPPGRPVGPRRLRAAAAGGDRAGPLAGRREDPRRRRGAARVVAGRRHVGLRGAAGDPGRVRRPGRRGPAHPVRRRAHRPAGVAARGRARRPARGGRHDPRGRGAPHRRARAAATRPSNGPARPSPSCCAASPCTAPTCRRAARRWTPPCRWPAPTAPTSPTCSTAIYAAMLADPRGELATRVQQTSGMVMAKGVEDTTFYRWNRFVALNEVGGAPDRFGVSPAEFHAALAEREAARPAHHDHALDARHQALRGRAGPPRGARRDAPGVGRPRAALVGAPPAAGPLAGAAGVAEPRRRLADPGRADGGLPREGVEGGQARHQPRRGRCRRWTRRSRRGPRRCSPTPSSWPRSRSSSPGSARPAGRTRWARSCCSSPGPGVPDVYQGTELFEYSLVDPDNRRPVDWAARRDLLARTRRGLAARRRRGGGGEAAGHDERAAAAPLPAGGVRRVPAAARRRARRRARGGVPAVVVRWSRWRPGCRSGWPPAAGGATRCSPLPDGAADWHDVVTDTAVDGGRAPARGAPGAATPWRCSSVPA